MTDSNWLYTQLYDIFYTKQDCCINNSIVAHRLDVLWKYNDFEVT